MRSLSFFTGLLTAAILQAKNRRIKRSKFFHAINIIGRKKAPEAQINQQKWFVPFVALSK